MPRQNPVLERGQKSTTAREYLQKYADLGVPEIVEKIRVERGLDLAKSMLYNIRADMRNSVGASMRKISPPKDDMLVNMGRLGKIIKDCGGFDETRRLLKMIEDMQVYNRNEE